MFSHGRYLYGSETHSTNVMLIKCAHTHIQYTHIYTWQIKLASTKWKHIPFSLERLMHFQLYVLPLQYVKYKISFKYLHWEVNITHNYSIYVSAYCGRQSHYDTVCPKKTKKNKTKKKTGTINSYCTLDIFKAYNTHFTCFTYDTHQSVGSKTTADVQYIFSVEPDILLTKEIVVVQYSHQVFDTAIPHIHL